MYQTEVKYYKQKYSNMWIYNLFITPIVYYDYVFLDSFDIRNLLSSSCFLRVTIYYFESHILEGTLQDMIL